MNFSTATCSLQGWLMTQREVFVFITRAFENATFDVLQSQPHAAFHPAFPLAPSGGDSCRWRLRNVPASPWGSFHKGVSSGLGHCLPIRCAAIPPIFARRYIQFKKSSFPPSFLTSTTWPACCQGGPKAGGVGFYWMQSGWRNPAFLPKSCHEHNSMLTGTQCHARYGRRSWSHIRRVRERGLHGKWARELAQITPSSMGYNSSMFLMNLRSPLERMIF